MRIQRNPRTGHWAAWDDGELVFEGANGGPGGRSQVESFVSAVAKEARI